MRHYSATELIAAGVDIRTVAGRLGHGGGGTTTLRVYAAWLSEADERVSSILLDRRPQRPERLEPQERAKSDPQAPFERARRRIPHDPEQLRRPLTTAARRHQGENAELGDYELEVRPADASELITTFASL